MASGIVTAVLLIAFLGVAVWAYSAKRKPTFDAASRMPLEEDQGTKTMRKGDQP